jgi:hypothetical protein
MFMRGAVEKESITARWMAAWRRHRRLGRLEPAPWVTWY